MSNIHQLVTALAQLERQRGDIEDQLEAIEIQIANIKALDDPEDVLDNLYDQVDELNDILDDIYNKIDNLQEEIDEESSSSYGRMDDDF